MSGFKVRYDNKFYDASYLPGESQKQFFERVIKEVTGETTKSSKFSIKQGFNKQLKKIVFEITRRTK